MSEIIRTHEHRHKHRRVHKHSEWLGLVLTGPALFLTLLFVVVPVCLMLVMSFFKWPMLGPKNYVGFANYIQAFTQDMTFRSSLFFTLLYTILITPLLYVAAFLLATLVQKVRFFTGITRTVIFSPYVIGFAAASYMWLWFISPEVGPVASIALKLGLNWNQIAWVSEFLPSLINVMVMVTWKVAGFQMVLILAGLNAIPTSIIEAAKLDRAGWWKRLVYIVLPMLRPTTLLVLVYSITGSLLAFEQFFIITRGRPNNRTITTVYWIYDISFTKFNFGYGAAISAILVVLVVIVTIAEVLLLRSREEN